MYVTAMQIATNIAATIPSFNQINGAITPTMSRIASIHPKCSILNKITPAFEAELFSDIIV
jgi:hypothetical protein